MTIIKGEVPAGKQGFEGKAPLYFKIKTIFIDFDRVLSKVYRLFILQILK